MTLRPTPTSLERLQMNLLTSACLIGVMLLSPLASVWAQAPAISDPEGRLIPGFDAPGEYPTTVTATNINFSPLPGVEFGGLGQDFLSVSFPSGGPLPWTASRYNAGDLGLLVGPADPNNSLSFPPAGFIEAFQPLNGTSALIDPNSHDLTTLGWRLSHRTGGLFATTRRNGIDSGYTIPNSGGQPLGNYFGVSYFGTNFGDGYGFNTETGVFGEGNAADLIQGLAGLAIAGTPQNPSFPPINEVSLDVAATYFPYEQGWTGAWVNAGANGPASFESASPGLSTSSVTWSGGQANISLPGVNSATDGLLFVAPSENFTSDTKIAAAFPNANGGWTATIRFDYLSVDGANFRPDLALQAQNQFQFLYVPYGAENLIGGHIEGTDGGVIHGAGQSLFSLTRTTAGQYALSVFEADGVTKKTEDDGTLLLSVADTFASDPTIGSQAFMSYEYDPTSGDFIIETRALANPFSATPNGSFLNEFQLLDTDFNFAWVDFENPLAPAQPLDGDYNGDGAVDAADYTVWRDGLGTTFTEADYDVWVANFGATGPASSAAVPEPTASLLYLVAVATAGSSLRARQDT